MGGNKEIVTLQLGEYANYVGAHYWNFADELLGLNTLPGASPLSSQVAPESTFRICESEKAGVSYHPRLVLFDMPANLGAVGRDGTIGGQPLHSDSSQVPGMWDGPVVVCHSEAVQPSAFVQQLGDEEEEEEEEEEDDADQEGCYMEGREQQQQQPSEKAAAPQPDGPDDLDVAAMALNEPGGVRYWTDFFKAVLHPRSIYGATGVWCGSDDWHGYGQGADVLATEENKEEAMDRIRFFAEECDHLQGFQVMAEDLGGWGRVTADLLSELRQDYSKSTVMLFSVRQGSWSTDGDGRGGRQDLCWRSLNPCLSLGALQEAASVYVPTTAPQCRRWGGVSPLQWDPSRWFHSSALCSAAIDTATLPYRLSMAGAQAGLAPTGVVDMDELLQIITRRRPSSELCLGALFAGLPAPTVQTAYALEAAGDPRLRAPTDTEAAPCPARISRVLPFSEGMTSASGRDVEAESVVIRGARTASGMAASKNVAAAAALDEMLMEEELQRRALRHRCVAMQPLPLPRSFPLIFSPSVGHSRTSVDAAPTTLQSVPKSMPVLTRLQHTGGYRGPVMAWLRDFQEARRTAAGAATLSAWGYAAEDLDEISERVHMVLSNLPQRLGDSDDDDDEESDVSM